MEGIQIEPGKAVMKVAGSKTYLAPFFQDTPPHLITQGVQGGDTKVIWSSANQEEVDAAKATFDRLKKKGFLAFRAKASGEKGEQIHEFDRTAEMLIMIPPMAAG